MRATPIIMAWAGLVVSCGAGDLALPPPPGFSASGSMLFVLETIDEPPRLFATPGSAPRLFSRELPPDRRSRIVALGYDASLDELGLPPGEVPLVPAEVCGARALPAQSSLHELIVDDRQATDWTQLDARPQAVASLRVEGPCPCVAFDEVSRVRTPQAIYAFFGRGSERLMLASDGSFYRTGYDGIIEAVETATRAPTRGLRAVHQQDDETYWIVARDALWRGGPWRSFERVRGFDEDVERVNSLDGGPGERGYELFAATEQGYLLQLRPEPERVLAAPRGVALMSAQQGRVLWLGPGEIVATEHGALDVFWMQDGVETRRFEVNFGSGGIKFLRQVPGVGLVAVSEDSRIFFADGYSLRERTDAPELATTATVLPYEGGFLYAGDDGFVQQYLQDFGFCPTWYPEDRARILSLYRIEDRIFAFTFGARGTGMELRGLAPRPL